MIANREYESFKEIVESIINNDKFKQMREIKQHRFTNCYEHSVNVATKCFLYAKKKNMKVEIYIYLKIGIDII